jgi:hypothetical protein
MKVLVSIEGAPTVAKITRQEAEDITGKIILSEMAERHCLLYAFENGAHIALGFGSFEDYYSERIGTATPALGEGGARRLRD